MNKQYFLLLQPGTDFKSKRLIQDKYKRQAKKNKEYARFKGTVAGGVISLIVSTIFGFLTINYLMGMRTSDNDTINMKKIIIDFDSNTTKEEDREKQWSKLPLMPSMDMEVSSSADVCKFDIFKEKKRRVNGVCVKEKEFTPMKIDPDKLKQYVVPYIDMTAEELSIGKKTSLKVRF